MAGITGEKPTEGRREIIEDRRDYECLKVITGKKPTEVRREIIEDRIEIHFYCVYVLSAMVRVFTNHH